MRRVFEALPGPVALKVVIVAVVILVLLVALGFVFEAAGDLLDDGGTIGT